MVVPLPNRSSTMKTRCPGCGKLRICKGCEGAQPAANLHRVVCNLKMFRAVAYPKIHPDCASGGLAGLTNQNLRNFEQMHL